MIKLEAMPLILTCEHASNKIPSYLKNVFQDDQSILKTHKAYDLGASSLLDQIKKNKSPFYVTKGKYSRLCIDLNRSLHHRNLFSDFTKNLPNEIKKKLEQEWSSYRNPIIEAIQKQMKKAPSKNILHLSIHSFTPKLNGIERNADIGILYNPSHQNEKEVAFELKKRILEKNPLLKIRMNYPYIGKSDGLATSLRKQFSKRYIGIELEVNQKWLDLNLKFPSI